MKKTLLALVLAGFVLAGCDQKATQEPAQPAEESPASVADPAVPVQLPVEGDEVMAQQVSDPDHTARHALDWNGTYTGVLPCADCEGIKTELVLQLDGTFTLVEVYLGKEKGTFEQEGTFNWNAAGNTVSLVGGKDEAVQYFVAENKLFRLDQNGERVTGDLASHYVLKKQ
ncbi:copper resistance protein NlpE [Photobacterium minamisatsumaniensis]|uniref:copper resistance protein NlpE n=1 Tax=Photobacterium minamisatsumaniensis TaxID=2910233 RepID=UPI003D0A690A